MLFSCHFSNMHVVSSLLDRSYTVVHCADGQGECLYLATALQLLVREVTSELTMFQNTYTKHR